MEGYGTAAPAVDPIYAAIEQHKDLAKTYDAAWKLRARDDTRK
jgi:hypothetical protein